MATISEQIGLRIGLTLTDSTIPTKSQVKEFVKEGIHKIVGLLTPEELWPLTRTTEMVYPEKGILPSDLSNFEENIEGFAQIVTIYRTDSAGQMRRCSEITTRDYHRAKTNTRSMLYGTETDPVFTYRNGRLVILPEPVYKTVVELYEGPDSIPLLDTLSDANTIYLQTTAQDRAYFDSKEPGTVFVFVSPDGNTEIRGTFSSHDVGNNHTLFNNLDNATFEEFGTAVGYRIKEVKAPQINTEINFLSTVLVNPEEDVVAQLPPIAHSAVINYATAQAANTLVSYYLQDDEGNLAQNLAGIADNQMKAFASGVQSLASKRKLRGHIA